MSFSSNSPLEDTYPVEGMNNETSRGKSSRKGYNSDVILLQFLMIYRTSDLWWIFTRLEKDGDQFGEISVFARGSTYGRT